MKRWVKAQYIPDMTERYPEGQGFIDYPDDIPTGPATLEEAVTQYKMDAESGDWYSTVKLIDSNGQLLLECTKLDDVLREFPKLKNAFLKNFWWHDADIMFRLL